jgi:hypothetical protein
MFGPPADVPAVWVGLALVSVLFVGLAVEVPRAPAPDAGAVAGTVDAAAASSYPTRAEHPTTATELKVSERSLALRNGAGASHAVLDFGPVTPASGNLSRVLRGAPPDAAFADADAFAAAARESQAGERWRETDGAVSVRTVTWGETRVTLVG